MVCCSRKTGLMVQMIIGICLSLIFTVLVIVWPTIFFNVLKNMSILSPTSYSFDLWKETPLPMYLKLYLYNFTNSEDVMKDLSIRPNFIDIGPYVFKEHHIKVNITWNDNGTVTFLQRRIWNFEPELSNGDLSDKITNINIIPVTAAYFVRDRSALVRLAVNSALKTFSESLIVTKTASELLFEGYDDRLLDIISELNISGLSLPFDKFGWFYGRNMSDMYDGWWTIQTGANDLNHLGDMDLWDFKNHVGIYDGECGAVKGTTGELFPPRTDPQNISVFASDICSYITLKRNGSTTVQGVEGALFIGDDQPFDNGYTYSDEACFCPPGVVCQPPGARNVSQCKFGAPAFVSYPHFYLADPKYTEKIDTPPPNAEKDEFVMGLNLATGIPLFVKAQFQINILVQRIPLIDMFDKLPDDIFVPVLWFQQEVMITEDLAKKAKLASSIEGIMSIVFYCLISLGILLVLVGIFVVAKYPLKRSESEALLSGS